jgi:HD-GYP domain-containing protein (c-di-GMP phosphodiesterase class II)
MVALFKNPIRNEELVTSVLKIFGARAGSEIERIHDEKELMRHLDELSILYEIASLASDSIAENYLLENATRIIGEALYPDHFGILLMNKDRTALYVHPSYQGLEDKHYDYIFQLGEGITGKVALTGESVRVGDVTEREDYVPGNIGMHSELSVPIISGDEIFGVINAESAKKNAFSQNDERLLKTIANQLAVSLQKVRLYEDIQTSHLELETAYEATLDGWARALEMRDIETEGHSSRVTEFVIKLASLIGIKDEDLPNVRRGALLHDVGKMGIPDSILLKPGKLTKEEWDTMYQHPLYAYNLLSSIPFLRDSLEIPYLHHEHWDGNGYPLGLKGLQIPLAARVFAVVDVWDALNSDRPYRKAWEKEKILDYIKNQSGKQFDPDVVSAFFRMLEEMGEI